MERSNVPNDKKQPSPGAPAKTTAATPAKSSAAPAKPESTTVPPVKPPRLFRPIDWAALVITFIFVFVAYYLTIAPEMTLEDSGELATGSFYAGIPHPPGYPVWTVFTYFWTLIPFGNVAWRVALAGCFAGALASALLAMIVSRGSSMMIESIDDLKDFDRRWENAICLVSGFVSGLLIGFNGYMWSQAVIVEVYPLSVVSLMAVLLCLMRWVYAPFQHRYLYGAFFFYGICVNNHQSLLVIAMGMEALVICADRKVGREMLMWNWLIFLAGALLKPEMLWGNLPVRTIFMIIGIGSIIGWVWLVIITKKKGIEFLRDGVMLIALGSTLGIPAGITHYVPKLSSVGAQAFLWMVAIASIAGFAYLVRETKSIGKDWLYTLTCGGAWFVGAACYLYMPISGATVPPMEWGYPRTLDGFIHALTRGQYDHINPTFGEGTGFHFVQTFLSRYLTQIWRYLEGLNDEFNILYLLLALVVFLFYLKMKKRERSWIIGMVAIFFCLGPFLVLLLNFPSDRQSLELNRVFLTSSHVIISMFIGFGLTLLATYLATHYSSARRIFMVIGLCIVDMAVFMLIIQAQDRFDLEKADWGMALGYFKILCWLLAATSAIVFWREGLKEDKLLSYGVPTFFGALSLIPTIMALTSLEKPWKLTGVGETMAGISEAFKPDHYGLPVLAALVLLALGFLFVAALFAYRNRAPLIVTLAVFAIMPSYSIFNHWFDNEQRNHWFGYWFGHDMFTPPVEGPDGKFTYDAKVRAQMMADPAKKNLVYPEMARDSILFGGTDPGRFAPTYMIFCDSFIPHDCLPVFDQNFDRRDVYIITQNALADPTYLQYIRSQYFRSAETNYDTPFFQELLRGKEEKERFGQFSGTTNILARWAYNLLDKPITEFGSRVETRRRKEGVYPHNEIYTPSQDDSSRAFQEYYDDAQQRIIHDQTHPNEPKQIKPGEDVRFDNNNHVQVQGQVAVMTINGLLTKTIFDHNPTNEFYVEESFPLDWMFPNLTPFGVIMKINRQPLPVLTEDILKRDHEFWAKYSERLIGNWITTNTSVKEITAFVERVYMHHDYTGFKGDLKFIRDDQGQKAFSKLRSSIAGIYSWRLGQPPSGGIMPAQYIATGTNRTMIEQEADFAYKQAFAFCPYSPEAVYRYVQLLVNLHRADDALAVAETAQRLDPYNPSFGGLIDNIRRIMGAEMPPAQIEAEISRLEKEIKPGSTDFVAQFDLAQKFMQLGKTDRVFQILDDVLANPKANVQVVMTVAKAYIDLEKPQKLQTALEALTRLMPDSPEAWYDLAASHASLDQSPAAIDCLKKSLQLNSQRLAKDPKASDIRATLASDARFAKLRDTPEFKALPLH